MKKLILPILLSSSLFSYYPKDYISKPLSLKDNLTDIIIPDSLNQCVASDSIEYFFEKGFSNSLDCFFYINNEKLYVIHREEDNYLIVISEEDNIPIDAKNIFAQNLEIKVSDVIMDNSYEIILNSYVSAGSGLSSNKTYYIKYQKRKLITILKVMNYKDAVGGHFEESNVSFKDINNDGFNDAIINHKHIKYNNSYYGGNDDELKNPIIISNYKWIYTWDINKGFIFTK